MAVTSRHLGASMLLVVASLVIGLAAADLMLRLIGFANPRLYMADEITGFAHFPGLDYIDTNEGRGHVQISSTGLRDREHSLTKPPGTFRIAVLGDSFAAALAVDRDEAFWAVLEERLNGCGWPDRVEVINFGVTGFGTAQELLMLRHRVVHYAPDLVLLAFLPGNDVRDNSRVLAPELERPFFTLGDKGQLLLDDSFRDDPDFRASLARNNRVTERWLREWRLPQLLRKAKRALKRRQPGAPGVEAGPTPSHEPGMDNEVFRVNPGRDWEAAWAVTEALVLQMQREATAAGAGFLVATLSRGIQVHPDPAATEAFIQAEGITDIFYPDRRIATLGAAHGIDVLMLAPALQALARATGEHLHGFSNTVPSTGHWNEAGHLAAGELISAHLCGSPPAPQPPVDGVARRVQQQT